MKIVIIGIGTIGHTILKSIDRESHTITVIDEDKEKIEENSTSANAFLNIAKNRDGKTAEVNLSWIPEYQLFREHKIIGEKAAD